MSEPTQKYKKQCYFKVKLYYKTAFKIAYSCCFY